MSDSEKAINDAMQLYWSWRKPVDALTNPPMPNWGELNEGERARLVESWEIYSCPHSCGGDVLYIYNAIRSVLREREQRVFKATMEGPPT